MKWAAKETDTAAKEREKEQEKKATNRLNNKRQPNADQRLVEQREREREWKRGVGEGGVIRSLSVSLWNVQEIPSNRLQQTAAAAMPVNPEN